LLPFGFQIIKINRAGVPVEPVDPWLACCISGVTSKRQIPSFMYSFEISQLLIGPGLRHIIQHLVGKILHGRFFGFSVGSYALRHIFLNERLKFHNLIG
tara:strand:- start:944 stop:1240 length:297 start_codon:yes stop_codon:yes gene_type:complete